MNLPAITIASKAQATELLGSSRSWDFTHVISINNPKENPPRTLKKHRRKQLCLFFHDVIDPPGLSGCLVPPKREDMEKILRFTDPMKETHHLLVHCTAGISRSSAAALAVIAKRLPPGPESARTAIEKLLGLKQIIHPNQNMVVDADKLLGYQGALVGAYRSTFRGEGLLWVPENEEAEIEF